MVLREQGYNDLGLINLIIVYGGCALSSLYAVPAMSRVGARCCIVVSALVYAMWMFAMVVPAVNKKAESEGAEAFFSRSTVNALSLLTATTASLAAGPLWICA